MLNLATFGYGSRLGLRSKVRGCGPQSLPEKLLGKRSPLNTIRQREPGYFYCEYNSLGIALTLVLGRYIFRR